MKMKPFFSFWVFKERKMRISKKELKKIIKEEIEEMKLGGYEDPSAFNVMSGISANPDRYQGSATAAAELAGALGIDKRGLVDAMEGVPDNWRREGAEAAASVIKDNLVREKLGVSLDKLDKLVHALLFEMKDTAGVSQDKLPVEMPSNVDDMVARNIASTGRDDNLRGMQENKKNKKKR